MARWWAPGLWSARGSVGGRAAHDAGGIVLPAPAITVRIGCRSVRAVGETVRRRACWIGSRAAHDAGGIVLPAPPITVRIGSGSVRAVGESVRRRACTVEGGQQR